MKVALVIESSKRISRGPAHEFYCGKGSRWITAVVDYLRECQFPKEHIYFLSFYNHRIIAFDEVIEDYPLQPAPKKAEQKAFAEVIFRFLAEQYPEAEVDLHVSNSISEHLVPMLRAVGRRYTLFAEGVQLGMKPNVYKDLILQERALRKMKELQKERERMIPILEHLTPHEADHLVTQYGHLGKQLGIEQLFSELKQLLKTYRQQSRQWLSASNEFYESIPPAEAEPLRSFFEQIDSISDLFTRGKELEELKQKHGKLLAKYTNSLIKQRFVKNTENRISEVLLRVQIALLKG
jgi:hypothetical protein